MLYGTINTSKKYDYEIIRITGGDYSGFYQEELLYKVASLCDFKVDKLPMIIYCPQILDWSGAKLSKSLRQPSSAMLSSLSLSNMAKRGFNLKGRLIAL